MDVKNCKSCGRLFNYMSGPVMCPNCQQVAEAMDVSVKQIKQWIREERLALSQPSADGILCEHCGTPICSGRFCDKCKVTMQNTLSSALDKPKEPEIKKRERDGNKMRFL